LTNLPKKFPHLGELGRLRVGMFWIWDVSWLGRFGARDVLRLGTFWIWDVLDLGRLVVGTFWGFGRFETGTFWGWNVLGLGLFEVF
jgi:hypothetical protein